MRILIATADDNVATVIASRLNWDDVRGELVIDGAEAVQMLGLYDYDAAIIDGVNGMSGLSLLRKARAAGKTPLILLSAMDCASNVAALDAGADDVIAKPFNADDLMARVRAIVRRAKGHARSKITIGALSIDLDRKTAEIDGGALRLTGKEYQMLEVLALRQGVTITKEMFLNHLYGGRDEPELKIIDVFICKLRRKLSAASQGRSFIETVWGRGYTIRAGDAPQPIARGRTLTGAPVAAEGVAA